jgi:hypothetical protein
MPPQRVRRGSAASAPPAPIAAAFIGRQGGGDEGARP